MSDIAVAYFDILLACFEADIWALSQWWMYAFVLPILFYIPVFFIKWAMLTAPLWMPLSIALGGVRVAARELGRAAGAAHAEARR